MKSFYQLGLRLSLALIFFYPSLEVRACSCGGAQTYCEQLHLWDHQNPGFKVLKVKVLDLYLEQDWDSETNHPLFVDMEILEVLHGTSMPMDTITFLGQDGLNCNFWLAYFQEGGEYLINLPEELSFFNPEDHIVWIDPLPEFPYPVSTSLTLCGVNAVKIEEGFVRNVVGPVYPGINEVPEAEFFENFDLCLGFDSGVDELNILEGLAISPNPTKDLLQITYQTAEVQKMELLDLQGRIIQEISTSGAVTARQEVDLSGLPAGLYLLTLYSNGERVTRRVVKQ